MQGIQPKNNNKGKAQMFVIFILSSLCIRIFYELTSIPTYPKKIRVLPGEESFVAKENGTDEKRIDWERNMFSEKPGSQQQEGSSSVDLSIVVPAYNETERLPAMLDQAIEFLQNPKVWIFMCRCFVFACVLL